MQRLAILGFIVRAPRGLAVDGDDVGIVVAQAGDPVHEARFEQLRIERVDDIGQGVVARDIVAKQQIAAQKIEAFTAPLADLDEIVAASNRRAEDEQHDLGQWEHDLGALARIIEPRKVVEQGDLRSSGGRRRYGFAEGCGHGRSPTDSVGTP